MPADVWTRGSLENELKYENRRRGAKYREGVLREVANDMTLDMILYF